VAELVQQQYLDQSSPMSTVRVRTLVIVLWDGYVYESGYTAIEFTVQSTSKPFTYALAIDQPGEAAVDAKIGVGPSPRSR
jgi:glutaminase